MGRELGYRDAVKIMGGDSALVTALDKALGGALSVATGGVSDAVLNLFDAQNRILRLGRDLTAGLRDRVRGASRVDRTRRLEAAHAVLVVTAYFEALDADAAALPVRMRDLQLTRQDQLRLATGSALALARDLVDALLVDAPPQPAPHLPYERFLVSLEQWYRQLSARLVAFLRGVTPWDELADEDRAEAERYLGTQLCRDATSRFQELHARLVLEVPEFGFWSGQVEHQATRAEIRYALTGVESLLAQLASAIAPMDTARALSAAYRAILHRSILSDGDISGVRMPTLAEGYVDPDFRVRAVTDGDRPADEQWWSGAASRSDLPEYLVGALTSPAAALAPLVVLGQPGAGKSVLTKVLAARLPATDFVPVRVVLREVPAEADIQDQIEYAVTSATGERTQWPHLARAAGGALPVILLDGFDELLQATGVNHSDYLVKVARFQEREADQGRPVAVIVTSRIAVADRARYPDSTVALRLEPFRPEQIEDWLGRWNRHNEESLHGKGLTPLPVAVVLRHLTLASQPLLLLMLALYDAETNALQRGDGSDIGGRPLDETTLYEQLLAAFARREVNKSGQALPASQVAGRVEEELQRLSLVAFAMVNRRRQWVTESELDTDLVTLLGRRTTAASDFRTPLSEADRTLGRFFFVQRAQAVRDGARLQTYEFLHASFGEYLVARLAVQLATGLLGQRPALTVGPTYLQDDLLYALLSFTPLSSRQQLRFVQGCAARQVAAADHQRLGALLIELLGQSTGRTEHRLAAYQPVTIPVSSRHGIYGANLVLLILALTNSVTTSQLFRDLPDPASTWHRRALLWRSALNEQEWTELALAMTVHYTWNSQDRDLEVRLATGPPAPPEPVDMYWHYGIRPEDERRGGGYGWRRPYLDEVMHKMAISGGTNDSIVRHTLEPLVRSLGPSIMTFRGHAGGRATSMAHDLLKLWLSSVLSATDDELATSYVRCIDLLGLAAWDDELHGVINVVLSQLRSDADRIPAAVVVACLRAYGSSRWVRYLPEGRSQPDVQRTVKLALECALVALSAEPADEERHELLRIAGDAAVVMRRISSPTDLLSVWVSVHEAGLTHDDVFDDSLGRFLTEVLVAAEKAQAPQHLLRRASATAVANYPHLSL